MTTSKTDVKAWLAPRTWSFLTGGAAALAITLGAGWLTTNGAADNRAQAAAVNAFATICAAQAQAGPESQGQLVAFEELRSSFDQRRFILDAGWAVMPNQTSADDAVVRGCAAMLAAAAD